MTTHDPAACHDCADEEIARLRADLGLCIAACSGQALDAESTHPAVAEVRAWRQRFREAIKRAEARATAAETLADGLGEALVLLFPGGDAGEWESGEGVTVGPQITTALAAWRKATGTTTPPPKQPA